MTNAADQTTKAGPRAAQQAARLAAVRALYEHSQNPRDLRGIAEDYDSGNRSLDDGVLPAPDSALLRKILGGAVDRFDELHGMIKVHMTRKSGEEKEPEPLLRSILIAGAYEILAHHDIDFPIIINDYVNITHAFYTQGEAKLVNAVLDNIARQLRT